MTTQQPAPQGIIHKVVPFVIGGSSGMIATCIIQPIDMVKVQIQLESERMGKDAKLNPFDIVAQRKKAHGMGFFYKGLSSALIRQMTYTTTRMGIYKSLFNNYKEKHGDVNLAMKSVFGLTAGFFGSIVGNPADLILIRIQADTNLPQEQRRNYKGITDAMKRIVQEDGFLSLWRGCQPTVLRAMALNLAMLGPFDEAKERLNKLFNKKDTIDVRLCASAIAGFLAAFCSLPFDNIKTKLQKMKYDEATKSYPYKNLFDCFNKSVQNEGFGRLWAGFPTYYTRIAPHAMITLLIQDFLTRKWNSVKSKY